MPRGETIDARIKEKIDAMTDATTDVLIEETIAVMTEEASDVKTDVAAKGDTIQGWAAVVMIIIAITLIQIRDTTTIIQAIIMLAEDQTTAMKIPKADHPTGEALCREDAVADPATEQEPREVHVRELHSNSKENMTSMRQTNYFSSLKARLKT